MGGKVIDTSGRTQTELFFETENQKGSTTVGFYGMSYNEFTLGELSTLYCFQSSISTGRGGGGGRGGKKERNSSRKKAI